MDIAFLDDSAQKGEREGMGKLVAMGGVIIDEGKIMPLAEEIDRIAASFKIPAGCELKWSPGKKNWIRKNLVGEKRSECYRKVFEAAQQYEVKVIVVVLDTGRTTVQGSAALRKALEWTIERVRVLLRKRDHLGIIVADRPSGGSKDETKFLEDALEMINYGSQYVEPGSIVTNVLTTRSDLVRGLQLADLTVGVTTAMVGGAAEHSAEVFPSIKPLFHANHMGAVGGTGLKVFPNNLINLYHWVLGEDTFWRVGKGTGWSLPMSNLPYSVGSTDSTSADEYEAQHEEWLAEFGDEEAEGDEDWGDEERRKGEDREQAACAHPQVFLGQ